MNTNNNISFNGSVLVKFSPQSVPDCTLERGWKSANLAINKGLMKKGEVIPVPVGVKSRECLLVDGIEKEITQPLLQKINDKNTPKMERNSLIAMLKKRVKEIKQSSTTKVIDYVEAEAKPGGVNLKA